MYCCCCVVLVLCANRRLQRLTTMMMVSCKANKTTLFFVSCCVVWSCVVVQVSVVVELAWSVGKGGMRKQACLVVVGLVTTRLKRCAFSRFHVEQKPNVASDMNSFIFS